MINTNKANKSIPLYIQIEEDIRYKILGGEWKPGDKILSEEEYCTIYKVSRITVRKAIQNLEIDGLLYRKSGKGTFVTDWKDESKIQFSLVKSFTNEMKELGKKAFTVDAEIEKIKADKTMAGFLGIDEGAEILQLKRLRGTDGILFAYSVNSFPYHPEFSLASEDYMESFYEYLKSFGIGFNHNKEYIEAVQAPIEVAKKLGIDESEPMLKRVKIGKNLETNFCEYNECYYIGSKYRYFIDLN